MILLTGGVPGPRGVPGPGGVPDPRGGCLVQWEVLGPRGEVCWGEGVCSRGVPGPGGCLVENPPGTATAASGTHPTGMHSCFLVNCHLAGQLFTSFVSSNNKNNTSPYPPSSVDRILDIRL